MALKITIAVSPPGVKVISSGPSWLTTIVTVLIGASAALAAQLVIQLYVVPRVETRKRREDRWEQDVRELSDLLTTQLGERAHDAHVGQGLVLLLRQLENDPGLDQRKLAQSREEKAQAAQQATRAFEDLLSTRIKLLTSRIEKFDPKAREIKKFHQAWMYYRARTIIAQDRVEDNPGTEAELDEAWDKERTARKALIEQVELLESLRHPPRASWLQQSARPAGDRFDLLGGPDR